MYRPFREHHLFQILDTYDEARAPMDSFLRVYFRQNKSVGSKDRKEIVEALYGMLRWKALLDHFCEGKPSWEERYKIYKEIDLAGHLEDGTIPPHVRLSFPKHLFSLLVDAYGPEHASEICLNSNFPAPTTIRVNTLKISRRQLLKKWGGEYDVVPCEHSPHGITFRRKINFFALEDFKKGFFEIQDEGSQLLASLAQLKKGDHIMDYCAGAGGKTLAFAPQLGGTGQIFLHDIREHALDEASKRLRRAGVQNAQIIKADSPHLKKLKKKMDWVFVDAPCSGSGTMRRNPDMKWRFDLEMLHRLIKLQRHVFEKALSFMRPGGRIVYATCSLFPSENEEQVARFVDLYDLEIEGEAIKTLPEEGKMDGFYGVVLKKRN
ncbi:Uncharacterized protein SCG7109_AP_00030 [Chlamydiales bacterium SCGC AG-110-M15]|nr:Uncharacterized protein SCG7109_AP_00030 [Chlamydiales bacterium SCGC AG-110-M15]